MADFTGEPSLTIAIPHRRIHQGVFFGAGRYFGTLGNNDTLDVLVIVGSKNSHSVPTWNAGGDCEARWFEDTTVSANGSEIPSTNHARYSSNEALTKVYSTPTITDDGNEQTDGRFIPGGSGPLAGGGTSSFNNEVVLKADTTYLFRITNRSGQGIILSFNLDWYENTRIDGNDDFFTATEDWQAIKADGSDITDGTFTIVNRDNNWVWLTKSDTIPNATDNGHFHIKTLNEETKYNLSAGESLYCKTRSGDALISVIPA